MTRPEGQKTATVPQKWVVNTTVLLALLGATASAAMAYKAATTALSDHETRITKVEAKIEEVAAMKRDIEWIRSLLEQQYGQPQQIPRRP